MAENTPGEHHKKRPHSFRSFWWHGFRKAITKSLEKYILAGVGFGLVYTIVAIFISNRLREEKFGGFDMSFWLTYAIPGGLLFLFLAYHIARAPYEIYLEEYAKHEKEIGEKDAAISQLAGDIKTLGDEIKAIKDSKPQLELMPSLSYKDIEGKCFCRIAVKNKSATGTAKHVKVEVVNIDPQPELREYSFWVGDVPYPMQLKPTNSDGNIIHPNCVSKFDLFIVNRDESDNEREKRAAFIYFVVHFLGQPKIVGLNAEFPAYKLGRFQPFLNDKKIPNLGLKIIV